MSMQEKRHSTGIEALLARYAIGDVSKPMDVLIRSHLELSSANREFVRDLEAMAGMALDETGPAALGNRARMLAAVFAREDETPVYRPVPAAKPHPVYPPALRLYLGAAADTIPWRVVLPGLKQHCLLEQGGTKASLYAVRAGRAMPGHSHAGSEVTLVLKGSFSDRTGLYRRGDIAIADEAPDPRPVAGPEEDCICYTIVDAPLGR